MAWYVNLQNGVFDYFYKEDQAHTTYRVWPVRSTSPALIRKTGQTIPYRTGDDGDLMQGFSPMSPRFTDHENGVVTDNQTGLVWTKDAQTPGPAECEWESSDKIWQGALDHVKCLNARNYLGISDWRLPNIKELQSLADYSQFNDAFPADRPFENLYQCDYLWSSTTGVSGTDTAWGFSGYDGAVYLRAKTNYGKVWPVRGGQAPDITPPKGTISINAGAACTNLTAVMLTLSCNDAGACAAMRFRNEGGADWSAEDAYGATRSWNLQAGEGTKTVYVQFKDNAGNWSQSYSDSIALYTTPPVTLPSISGGAYAAVQIVALTIREGSIVYYTTDGSDPVASATRKRYAGPIYLTATTTLKYYAADAAGNVESVKTGVYTIASSSIPSAKLSRTGQTRCYDLAGNTISCSGTGQDGEIRAGVAWPDPRFSPGVGAQADCITDNLTGLMWPKNGNLSAGAKNWNDAVDYPQTLTLCGHSDWRLPSVNELESLVNSGEEDLSVWLGAQGFANVQSNSYWSSTTDANLPMYYAWRVSIWSGSMYVGDKSGSYYVWPVRAGQAGSFGNLVLLQTGQTRSYRVGDDGDLRQGSPWPSPRFTNNGDGTVRDDLTGLTWSREANVPGPSTCSPGSWKSWQEALDYVKCLNSQRYLGHSDWRLPNRKELESLTDHSQYNPSLPSDHPFADVHTGNYWSSDTHEYWRDYAWCVDLYSGRVGECSKASSFYVWPVYSSYNLAIVKSGTGEGSVTSSPTGIDCGTTCSASYNGGTSVTISAAPAAGSVFTQWSGGGCSGAGACTVTMDAAKEIMAVFTSTDFTAPTGTIEINSNASDTNDIEVTITLSCMDSESGCEAMKFSNSESANWSMEEAYTTTKSWNLLPGAGTKTAYVKFRDHAGNWSAIYSDTIVLDTSTPMKGDIDRDGQVTIADAISSLQVLCGLYPTAVAKEADVDGDGKIGLAEVIYILQKVAGLR